MAHRISACMGIVKVVGELGLEPEELVEVEFKVDTGSLYTFVSPGLADQLGLDFPISTDIVLANNTHMRVPLGVAYLRLQDREGGIPVGSLDVPMPLLGVTALEILGFKVNPIDQTIEYDRPFGPCAL